MSGDNASSNPAARYLNYDGIVQFLNAQSSQERDSLNGTVFSLRPVEKAGIRRNPFLLLAKDKLGLKRFATFEMMKSSGSYAGHNENTVGDLYVETGEFLDLFKDSNNYDFLEWRLREPLVLPSGIAIPRLNIKIFASKDPEEEWEPVSVERRDHVKRGYFFGWRRKSLESLIPDKVFLPQEFERCPKNYEIDRGAVPNWI
jgi:hypothetical protein